VAVSTSLHGSRARVREAGARVGSGARAPVQDTGDAGKYVLPLQKGACACTRKQHNNFNKDDNNTHYNKQPTAAAALRKDVVARVGRGAEHLRPERCEGAGVRRSACAGVGYIVDGKRVGRLPPVCRRDLRRF